VHRPLRTKEIPIRSLLLWRSRDRPAVKRRRRYCEWLYVGMFGMKCSSSLKFMLGIPLPLPIPSLTMKRSNQAREIKGLFSVLWLKYYVNKVWLSFQILSSQTKIRPTVLIILPKYIKIYIMSSFLACISIVDTFEPLTEIDIKQLLKRSIYVVHPILMWFLKVTTCSNKPSYRDS